MTRPAESFDLYATSRESFLRDATNASENQKKIRAVCEAFRRDSEAAINAINNARAAAEKRVDANRKARLTFEDMNAYYHALHFLKYCRAECEKYSDVILEKSSQNQDSFAEERNLFSALATDITKALKGQGRGIRVDKKNYLPSLTAGTSINPEVAGLGATTLPKPRAGADLIISAQQISAPATPDMHFVLSEAGQRYQFSKTKMTFNDRDNTDTLHLMMTEAEKNIARLKSFVEIAKDFLKQGNEKIFIRGDKPEYKAMMLVVFKALLPKKQHHRIHVDGHVDHKQLYVIDEQGFRPVAADDPEGQPLDKLWKLDMRRFLSVEFPGEHFDKGFLERKKLEAGLQGPDEQSILAREDQAVKALELQKYIAYGQAIDRLESHPEQVGPVGGPLPRKFDARIQKFKAEAESLAKRIQPPPAPLEFYILNARLKRLALLGVNKTNLEKERDLFVGQYEREMKALGRELETAGREERVLEALRGFLSMDLEHVYVRPAQAAREAEVRRQRASEQEQLAYRRQEEQRAELAERERAAQQQQQQQQAQAAAAAAAQQPAAAAQVPQPGAPPQQQQAQAAQQQVLAQQQQANPQQQQQGVPPVAAAAPQQAQPQQQAQVPRPGAPPQQQQAQAAQQQVLAQQQQANPQQQQQGVPPVAAAAPQQQALAQPQQQAQVPQSGAPPQQQQAQAAQQQVLAQQQQADPQQQQQGVPPVAAAAPQQQALAQPQQQAQVPQPGSPQQQQTQATTTPRAP